MVVSPPLRVFTSIGSLRRILCRRLTEHFRRLVPKWFPSIAESRDPGFNGQDLWKTHHPDRRFTIVQFGIQGLTEKVGGITQAVYELRIRGGDTDLVFEPLNERR